MKNDEFERQNKESKAIVNQIMKLLDDSKIEVWAAKRILKQVKVRLGSAVVQNCDDEPPTW